MTDHYEMAERLLDDADEAMQTATSNRMRGHFEDYRIDERYASNLIAEAQVHATLALAELRHVSDTHIPTNKDKMD